MPAAKGRVADSGEPVIIRDGFAFRFDPAACRACLGACCRGRTGIVRVNQTEIEALASFLEMNVFDFAAQYLERRHNLVTIRELRTEQESLCLFFDSVQNRCRVYPVRPARCRSFPFWDVFRRDPGRAAAECPGVTLLEPV